MRKSLATASVLCAFGLSLAACAPSTGPAVTPNAPPPAAPVTAPATPPATPPAATATSDGLPDGPGKAEVAAACSNCHSLGEITSQHRTAAQWSTTVTTMINNGASVSNSDFDKIVGYLAAHFGP